MDNAFNQLWFETILQFPSKNFPSEILLSFRGRVEKQHLIYWSINSKWERSIALVMNAFKRRSFVLFMKLPDVMVEPTDVVLWLSLRTIFSTAVTSIDVNCEPLSVLNMSGLQKCARASSTASIEKAVSIVIDSLDDKTRRLNLSTTAQR